METPTSYGILFTFARHGDMARLICLESTIRDASNAKLFFDLFRTR